MGPCLIRALSQSSLIELNKRKDNWWHCLCGLCETPHSCQGLMARKRENKHQTVFNLVQNKGVENYWSVSKIIMRMFFWAAGNKAEVNTIYLTTEDKSKWQFNRSFIRDPTVADTFMKYPNLVAMHPTWTLLQETYTIPRKPFFDVLCVYGIVDLTGNKIQTQGRISEVSDKWDLVFLWDNDKVRQLS